MKSWVVGNPNKKRQFLFPLTHKREIFLTNLRWLSTVINRIFTELLTIISYYQFWPIIAYIYDPPEANDTYLNSFSYNNSVTNL